MLPGVLYCRVYSNRSNEVVKGRPPKSFESIVEGGIDKEIAEAIFDKGPAGIEPFGNTMVEIKDSEGTLWKIGFTRPVPCYIWLRIIIEKDDEEDFPNNGIELMKDRIIDWSVKNLWIGRNLKYQKLLTPIHSVPGTGRAKVLITATGTIDTPDESEYAMQNIVVDEREIAIIDKTRIAIEEKTTVPDDGDGP
jgi:hypothetical protein